MPKNLKGVIIASVFPAESVCRYCVSFVHFLNKPEHRLRSEEETSQMSFIKFGMVNSLARERLTFFFSHDWSNWFNYLAGICGVEDLWNVCKWQILKATSNIMQKCRYALRVVFSNDNNFSCKVSAKILKWLSCLVEIWATKMECTVELKILSNLSQDLCRVCYLMLTFTKWT